MNPNLTQTENGALQLRTSGCKCLDLFAEIASSRGLVKTNHLIVEDMFLNAYAEDPKTATLILYWVRAVRLGAGERSVFHLLHKYLNGLAPETVKKNLALIGELGYYKDYVTIVDEMPEYESAVVDIFANGVKNGNYFACKWLPRHHKLYALVRKALGMSNGDFRRHVAKHSATVEQQLCAKKIGEIDYSKVPSLALNRYKKTFTKKDHDRFIAAIVGGDVKSSVLHPHQIFSPLRASRNADEKAIINAQWNALPDYLKGAPGILTVLDTSGSMRCSYGCKIQPSDIATPLALYCAERCGGVFKNSLIEFSERPRWVNLKGDTSADRMDYLLTLCDNASNTNVAAVFKMLLDRAINAKVPQEEMPSTILILSDMQFDSGANYNTTLIDELRCQYKYAGYKFPSLVYWNLNATNTGVVDNENCALVSGFSPRIMESVLACMPTKDEKTTIDPVEVMNKALEPLRELVDLSSAVELPSSIAKRDFNPTRGQSARVPLETQSDDCEEDDSSYFDDEYEDDIY